MSHVLKGKPDDDISTNALFTCGNCAMFFFLPHMGLVILNQIKLRLWPILIGRTILG